MARSSSGAFMAKIGICGTHSTGKTTLLNALRSEKVFKDYTVCDEVTRTIKALGIPINENGTDTTQRLVMNQHIVNLALYENMLTDRTVIDGLAYTEWLYERGNLSTETLDYANLVTRTIASDYDIIFWLIPEFDIVNDGVRSVDKGFRDQVHDKFKTIITSGMLGVDVVKVTGSVRERVDTILKECKKRGLIGEY